MGKVVENQYGIKVGDIFYSDRRWGIYGHFIQFFQVVALKETDKVVIKEIKRQIDSVKEEEKVRIIFAIPSKNNFEADSSLIEDNNIGATKLIKKGLDSNENIIYITMDYKYFHYDDGINKKPINEYAYLWDGIPKEHYSDFFKYFSNI